jgi:hypothetical protein
MPAFKNYKAISCRIFLFNLSNSEPVIKFGVFHVTQDTDIHEMGVVLLKRTLHDNWLAISECVKQTIREISKT